MKIDNIRKTLAESLTTGFDFYERRNGKYQLYRSYPT